MTLLRYRGLNLYDFLKSTDVGLKNNADTVIIKATDGSKVDYKISEIKKNVYVDTVGGGTNTPMLAYGAGNVNNEDVKAGSPLVPDEASDGYDSVTDNKGGPIKFMIGQINDADQNNLSCLKNVESIEVTASAQVSWNHNSAEVYKQYLDNKLTINVVDKDNKDLYSKVLTVAEIEAMTNLISQEEIYATATNTWEGVNFWQLIQQEIGTIEGASDPITVTVTAKDGYSTEILGKVGLDALQNGIKSGENYIPVILAYAMDGYPLVSGGKNEKNPGEGYDSTIDNKGGPLRLMVNGAQGACIMETEVITVKVGEAAPPVGEADFSVKGVDKGELSIADLKKLGAEEREYTCKKSTDKVKGVLLKDVLGASLGVTDENATFTINAKDGYETSEASYRDITLKDAIDQNYFVAYSEYDAATESWIDIADTSKDGVYSGNVRIYRNYNEALGLPATTDWRNKCTTLLGITVSLPEVSDIVFDVVDASGAAGALPMSGLRSTSMSMNGDLWVGTYGGGASVRLAGLNSFTTYNTATTPALETAVVSAIAADEEGGVWFSQNASYVDPGKNKGLGYMKDGEVKYFRASDSPATIPNDYVQAIEIDKDGMVWFGSFGGLTMYNPDKGSWQTWGKEDGMPAASVDSITFDADGGIWLGFYPESAADDGSAPFTGGFAYFKDGKVVKPYTYTSNQDPNTVNYRLGDVWVRDIAVDANGGAWIVASGSYQGMSNKGGTVWYVSSPGADAVQYSGFELLGEKTFASSSNSEIRTVEFDPDGGLWFGTSADGLVYVQDPALVDGAMAVTAKYFSGNKAWSDSSSLDNIYDIAFYGKTIYAASAAGLITHKFAFENTAGDVNPQIGDSDADKCDIEISGAGAQNDLYSSIRGLKNAEGITKLLKTYNWMNSSGSTGSSTFEGDYLENILNNVVGLKDNAYAIRVISMDGKYKEFSLEDLSAVDLDGNKPMLAWQEDGGKINLKIAIGQYAEGQVNKGKWVKDVNKIIVLAKSEKSPEVNETIEAINAIGEVTLDSRDAIAEARALYDRLDDKQKAKVSNYDTLVAAEAAYEALRLEAVVAVGKKLIDEIDYSVYDASDMTLLWIKSQKLEIELNLCNTSDEAEAVVQKIQKTIAETPTTKEKVKALLGTAEWKTARRESTQVTLNWKETGDADGYRIYRSDSAKGTYSLIKTIKDYEELSYIDTDVNADDTYYYKIRAYKLIDNVRYFGNYATVKTVKEAIETPEWGTFTRGTDFIRVRWTAIEGADSYLIYRSKTGKTGSFTRIITVPDGDTVMYKNTGLPAATTYYYKIRASKTVDGVRYLGDLTEGKSTKTLAEK